MVSRNVCYFLGNSDSYFPFDGHLCLRENVFYSHALRLQSVDQPFSL